MKDVCLVEIEFKDLNKEKLYYINGVKVPLYRYEHYQRAMTALGYQHQLTQVQRRKKQTRYARHYVPMLTLD